MGGLTTFIIHTIYRVEPSKFHDKNNFMRARHIWFIVEHKNMIFSSKFIEFGLLKDDFETVRQINLSNLHSIHISCNSNTEDMEDNIC